MKFILCVLILLIIISCGSKNKVVVSGGIDVTQKIDIKGAVEQLSDACKATYPDDKDNQAKCFQDSVNNFFKLLDKNPKG